MKTLIEKLEEKRSRYHNEVVVAEDIIDDCIEIVKQHSDWISVSERLPEKNGEYLVFIRNDFLGYQFVPIFTTDTGAKWSIKDVTHWQPLPQPPSEVHNAT